MNSQMSPEDFRGAFALAVSTEPAEPLIADQVEAGRRRLRKRRFTVAVAGCAAAVVVVAGAGWAMNDVTNDRAPDKPQPAEVVPVPASDDELVDACRDGAISEQASDALFASGAPLIKATSQTSARISLALESADGAHWAACGIDLTDETPSAGLNVFDLSVTGGSESWTWGQACPLVDGQRDPECSRFMVEWIDRRPDVVAAVEFVTGDGKRTRVESPGGYVAFAYVGDYPDGLDDSTATPVNFHSIRRITFFDAGGEAIASEAQYASAAGQRHDKLDGLPTLSAFSGAQGQEIESD